MICLHCGHCCINYDVMIMDSPDKGHVPDNIIHKPTGVPCKHLVGTAPGNYSCSIHDHPNYKSTPCDQFTQMEYSDTVCRMGEYILNQIKKV